MTVYETLLKRRSIRSYKNQKVEEEKIIKLLEAAMAAPSARNEQPWEFYVVENETKLQQCRDLIRNYNFNSPLIIVVCGNKNAPLAQLNVDYWIQDGSAAISNLLNEAVELGLGTVWCGVYPGKERVEGVSKILGCPENIIPLGLIHVGYPDEEKEPRTQYSEEKIHRL